MALTPEQINDYVSKLFNDPMGEVYRLAKFEAEARSKIDKLQGDVKYANQQRDHFGAELGKYQKELVEVRQRRDQLGIENAELHGQLRNLDTVMNVLNDRITELEGENQNLLRRIGELRNSSTYKLQQENEQLRKENEELKNVNGCLSRVKDEAARAVQSISESPNEALKKGNEESPTTSTKEKETTTIEAWLVGNAVDRLQLVWATESFIKSFQWAITKRANELNFSDDDDAYFAPVKVTL